MPFWIENQKRYTSEKERITRKTNDANLLNKRQRPAYNIVAKNLSDNLIIDDS